MRVVVTGATGYVGQHVIPRLLARNHEIIAIARNEAKAKKFKWYKDVTFIAIDLHLNPNIFSLINKPIDAVIHLAWPDLPNYQQSFHLTKNFPSDVRFFEEVINYGVNQIIIAGTCLEYGMQSGGISENSKTNPCTPYGLAKDSLRKWLEIEQKRKNFTLQWVRLFYSYGEGQSQKSILSQLEQAINSGDDVFNMSAGEQLRDYLTIEQIADYFLKIFNNPKISGVMNCCSENPVKISDLVEQYLLKKAYKMKLNKGFYPYPDYEPLEFWGILGKLKEIN